MVYGPVPMQVFYEARENDRPDNCSIGRNNCIKQKLIACDLRLCTIRKYV
jgi:hypothetical protein